jgi:hypothetical protein
MLFNSLSPFEKFISGAPALRGRSGARRFVCAAFCCLAIACAARAARAQDAPENAEQAPPPRKVLAAADKTKLDSARDARERTRFTIELADAHLTRAAQLTDQKDYDGAADELGFYQAVITDALKFLERDKEPNNRQRDLFKRIELALRAYAPRIEGIRRNSPAEYAENVRAVYDFTRNARDEALNIFYGNTVLREEPPKPRKPM